MSSRSKHLLLFILFSSQNLIASRNKLLNKDLLQFAGDFLRPESEQKMKQMNKQWNIVKIYENIFPNYYEVAVFRNVNRGEIVWETIKFKKLWKPLLQQKELMSHLCQNDSAKWYYVFVWLIENWIYIIENKFQNDARALLKALMRTIAETIPVKFTDPEYENSPLMIAAAFDDIDSILTLIKRGTDVNQQNKFGGTALHNAAGMGNIFACATLIEENANIDALNHGGYTSLMVAARYGKKDVFKFLIGGGADKNLVNNDGKTASQIAKFKEI
jgi:hypothetical protein